MADRKKTPPFVRTETIHLAENHGWRASPGHKVMVVGRGDLRFEYPQSWVHEITAQSVKLRDKTFPKDVMLLEVSVLRTPAPAEWNRVPSLTTLLLDNLRQQGQPVEPGAIHTIETAGLEMVWAEYPKIEEDPQTKQPRPAIWRQAHCHAGKYHQGTYMPFGIITFGFWSEHRDVADPFWEHFLASLVLGDKITDPAQGPRYN